MPRIAEATEENLADAARRLRAGRVVAFPTETVYGLGADAFNHDAIAQIYRLKARPQDNPLIAHVVDVEMAQRVVEGWDDRCAALAARFWPGPLTLVLRRRDAVPALASAGLPTLAVRAPAHRVAEALLRTFGGVVIAPSANRSGHVSPTCAAHVADDFADQGDLLILDGGPCDVGIESTVLDLTSDPARILRPGSVGADVIGEVIGPIEAPAISRQDASPGTRQSHYAPRRPARLVNLAALPAALARETASVAVLCLEGTLVAAPHRAIPMPREAVAYAAALYDRLRQADAHDVACIIIEAPPTDSPLWRAIHDRLRRATV